MLLSIIMGHSTPKGFFFNDLPYQTFTLSLRLLLMGRPIAIAVEVCKAQEEKNTYCHGSGKGQAEDFMKP